MSNKPISIKSLDFCIGQVINYNFLYSNEEEKFGLVIDVKKDNNFYAMIYVLTDNEIDIIPYSIMTYKVV